MDYALLSLIDRHPIKSWKESHKAFFECLTPGEAQAPWSHLYDENGLYRKRLSYDDAYQTASKLYSGDFVIYGCVPDTVLPREIRLLTGEPEGFCGGYIAIPADEGRTTWYVKFNDERMRECALVTEIISGADGEKYVCKYAAAPAAQAHLDHIERGYTLTRDLCTEVTAVSYERKADGIYFPFIEGESLLSDLDFSCDDRDTIVSKIKRGTAPIFSFSKEYIEPFVMTDEFVRYFGDYPFSGEREPAVSKCNLDCNYDNYCMSDGEVFCFDYEWALDFPVPIAFLEARMLRFLYDAHEKELNRIFSGRDAFLSAFGYDAGHCLLYRRMEEHFAEAMVHGDGFLARYGQYYEGIPVTYELPYVAPSKKESVKSSIKTFLKKHFPWVWYNYHYDYGKWIRRFEHAAPSKAFEIDDDFILLIEPNHLSRDAIDHINAYIKNNPSVDAIYSDEDVIDERGYRWDPKFKPDYNPDLNLCTGYIGKFLAIRKGTTEESAEHIGHIPRVLYHRPIGEDSPEIKKIKRPPLYSKPLVSIIIADRSSGAGLYRCITTIEDRCRYRHIEIIAVTKKNVTPDRKRAPHLSLISYDGADSLPAMYACGRKKATGEYLLFLDSDTEYLAPDSVVEMLSLCMREGTAIVGAKLIAEDMTIAHAGMIIGVGGMASCAFCGKEYSEKGYGNRIQSICDYSAVSGAAMMIGADFYDSIGGFDETYTKGLYDADICLRAGSGGQLVVYTPYAAFLYHGGQLIDSSRADEKLFSREHGDILTAGDPDYNPNLSQNRADFTINMA